MTQNEYYVYLYLREDGTPYYVGKGKNDRAFSRKGRNVHLPLDENNIIFHSKNLTEDEAFKIEKEVILQYGRKNNNTGILRNLTDGGEGCSGMIHREDSREKLREHRINETYQPLSPSKEIRNKISEILQKGYAEQKYKPHMLGKNHTEEHKQKLSQKMSGRKLSEEHIKNMSIAFKGRKISEAQKKAQSERQKGKKASEETKQKQTQSQKERWKKMSLDERKTIGDKISEKNRGRTISEKGKENLSKKFTGAVYINNGLINKRLMEGQLLSPGWMYGRLSYKKKLQESANLTEFFILDPVSA